MKKIALVGLVLCLLLLAWVYLNRSSTTPPPPETESENLNELLRAAPISWIDLESTALDTLLISAENVIYPQLQGQGQEIFDNSIRAFPFHDNLVVFRYGSPEVYVFNKEGQRVQAIGAETLRRPSTIQSDGNELYIHDYDRKRMFVYDSDFSLVRDFSFENPYYMPGSVAMSKSHLAFQDEEASGFRVSRAKEHLLSVVEINEPESEVFSGVPRIVPAGKHPGAFNNLKLSMNTANTIVAGYPALPYLFVYDDFEHSQNIFLQSLRFDKVENPSLQPFDPVMGEAVRVNNLMDNIQVMDNGDILLYSMGILHHLERQPTGSYNLEKKYTLIREDSGEEINSVNSIARFPVGNTALYLSGMGSIIKLNFPG